MHDMRAAEETKASSLLDSSTRDCVLAGPPFTARAPSSRLEHRIPTPVMTMSPDSHVQMRKSVGDVAALLKCCDCE